MKNTVVHIAALYGKDEWVNQVIEKAPFLLAAKNNNDDTALHLSARAGHISTLNKLLAAILSNVKNQYFEKPKEALNEILVMNKQGNHFFHEALLNDHKDVITKILDFLELEIEGDFKACHLARGGVRLLST
ncbi:hypothetical protein VNO78_12355 [Psophocarpus tetragonolobus]|uniref:Uncharacterized protein n=1 Tax=Psophocarpus tetragonolobus TaxID=3891 RepID=A0AAN9SNZ2_PSOTE